MMEGRGMDSSGSVQEPGVDSCKKQKGNMTLQKKKNREFD
jgi:hypothetical protein